MKVDSGSRLIIIGWQMSLLALLKFHRLSWGWWKCGITTSPVCGMGSFSFMWSVASLAVFPSEGLSQFQQHSLHFPSTRILCCKTPYFPIITPKWPTANKWLSLVAFAIGLFLIFQERLKHVCIWFALLPACWTVYLESPERQFFSHVDT